jgi:hypothetical protein
VIFDITERKRAEQALQTHIGGWKTSSKPPTSAPGNGPLQTGETVYNEVWAQIVGYTARRISPHQHPNVGRTVHPEDLKLNRDDLLERHFEANCPSTTAKCA